MNPREPLIVPLMVFVLMVQLVVVQRLYRRLGVSEDWIRRTLLVMSAAMLTTVFLYLVLAFRIPPP